MSIIPLLWLITGKTDSTLNSARPLQPSRHHACLSTYQETAPSNSIRNSVFTNLSSSLVLPEENQITTVFQRLTTTQTLILLLGVAVLKLDKELHQPGTVSPLFCGERRATKHETSCITQTTLILYKTSPVTDPSVPVPWHAGRIRAREGLQL